MKLSSGCCANFAELSYREGVKVINDDFVKHLMRRQLLTCFFVLGSSCRVEQGRRRQKNVRVGLIFQEEKKQLSRGRNEGN